MKPHKWTKAKLAKQKKINDDCTVLFNAYYMVQRAQELLAPNKRSLPSACKAVEACMKDMEKCYLKYLGYTK